MGSLQQCRYCNKSFPKEDFLRLFNYPDIATWENPHYLDCESLSRYLKCRCGDLRHRCKCDLCGKCLKNVNIECECGIHPIISVRCISDDMTFSGETRDIGSESPDRKRRNDRVKLLSPLVNEVCTSSYRLITDQHVKDLTHVYDSPSPLTAVKSLLTETVKDH